MTPLSLAAQPALALAFMRDVVGYGQLPGESSRVEDFAELGVEDRATVLAWYWPQRAYDDGFDPFTQFEDAAHTSGGSQVAQLRLRALASERLGHVIWAACLAATRTPEEVVGAVCWTARCSGRELAGALDASTGLRFEQILAICRTVGLRYIDPLDESVSSWTSTAAEIRRRFNQDLSLAVKFSLRLVADAAAQLDDPDASRQRFEEAIAWIGGLPTPLHVDPDAARAAFQDRSRLADPAQAGAVLADLLAQPGSEAHATTLAHLTESLNAAAVADRSMLAKGLQMAADQLELVMPELEPPDQGHGWLMMDRPTLGSRIDDALSELDSVSDLRARLRQRYNPGGERNPLSYRPGDTFSAPPLGSRYRGLYEALATANAPLLTLNVDPERHKVYATPEGIDLPRSAIRDKAWWSGSGRSTTGRPQVRAWWAAGYMTPQLQVDDKGRVTSARFASLPGRSEWLTENETEWRLAHGRYTVPSEPETPYHAVFSYEGPSVWDMSDEQVKELTATLTGPQASATAAAGKNGTTEGGDGVQPPPSDAQQIDRLVTHLREHGETDRKGIEALFARPDSTLSEELDFAKWLPNLLAKARRQGRIENIGTRKQPRWVATGTPAHLAAQLAFTLGQDEHGNQIERITPPSLTPSQPIPAELYLDAIRHSFPHLTPEPNAGEAPATADHQGETFLTGVGMSAVLAGRHLTHHGVKALLNSIRLSHQATWDAAAAEAAPNSDEIYVDEEEILGL